MQTKFTEANFESRFWDSCSVWRVMMPFSDPFGNQVGGLVLDMDYIIEVLPNGTYWHAPAMLEFHGITDLNINISSSNSGFQNAPSGFLVESLNRTLVLNQKVFFDKLYYSWTIHLISPPSQSGHLAFGAYGFTFRVGEPVLSKSRSLSA